MKQRIIIPSLILAAMLAAASCGTKRAAVSDGEGGTKVENTAGSSEKQRLRFVQKVSDNAVYTKNIVSKIDFTLNVGGKDISVGGSIHMRKDDVIRIQLTPMGIMEVGRIELTKDYVLVMDRIHKQYVKADYNEVDFLRDNGLNFYSLQAMFWNQLFIPGEQRVSESALENYEADLSISGTTVPVMLQQDKMKFTWNADRQSGLIRTSSVVYNSKQHGTSRLDWNYSAFKPLGTKQFPTEQSFTISTPANKSKREIKVNIKMNKLTTASDWEPRTTVSGKYTQMSVEDVIGKLMDM